MLCVASNAMRCRNENAGDIVQHCYVPVNNYRGITLSPVVSKLFEYCILHKNDCLTVTIELQFEFFKAGWLRICNICSPSVCSVFYRAWYYCVYGSTRRKKTFDRVNHVKLLHRLCDVGCTCTLSSDDYELVQQDICCREMVQFIFNAISC